MRAVFVILRCQEDVAAGVSKHQVVRREPIICSSSRVKELVSADFFVAPTASFRLLFVFVILSHDRRRPVHFAVTRHPTAEWTAQQLVQAFPWDTAPRYLLRDRDGNYGKAFREKAAGLRIRLRVHGGPPTTPEFHQA